MDKKHEKIVQWSASREASTWPPWSATEVALIAVWLIGFGIAAYLIVKLIAS
jgi:hypothetical protein